MSNIKTCEMIPITELLECIVDNRGKTCPTCDDGFPLIATNCIKHSSIYPTFENIRYVSDETLKTWFRAELKPNDILFVNKGTPGRVCLVPDPITFCVAQDMVGLRADSSKIYYKYLFAALRSSFIQEKIANFHVGIAIPHFKKSDMNNIKIPLPNMKIQKLIGDIYFTISEKIENNNKINYELENMIKTIIDYWLTKYNVPYEKCSLIDNIVKRVKVGYVGTIDKFYCDKNDGVAIIRPAEITEQEIDYSSLRYVTKEFHYINKKSQLHKGDILISRCGKEGIPVTYERDDPAQVLNAVIIEPNENVISGVVIKYLLKLPFVQKQINNMTSGSVQGVINTKSISNLLLPINLENDVKELEDKIIMLDKLIVSNNKQNQELTYLREFILPLIMNGQVSFKVEEDIKEKYFDIEQVAETQSKYGED